MLIEYEKAFDLVDHVKIIESLNESEMCSKEVRLIRKIYWSQKVFVETNNDNSRKPISITRGNKRSETRLCLVTTVVQLVY